MFEERINGPGSECRDGERECVNLDFLRRQLGSANHGAPILGHYVEVGPSVLRRRGKYA